MSGVMEGWEGEVVERDMCPKMTVQIVTGQIVTVQMSRFWGSRFFRITLVLVPNTRTYTHCQRATFGVNLLG